MAGILPIGYPREPFREINSYVRDRLTRGERAQGLGAVVITFDEDFAGARMYPAGTHS